MGDEFILGPLRASRVLQAYPLVREVAADVTLEGWRAFAQAILAPRRKLGRGIIAAWSENDYLRGLFAYRIVPDMSGGRALTLECFVVGSLFSPHAGARALLRGAEDVARANRCTAVRAELRRRTDWLDALLSEHGYDHRTRTLGKLVDPAGEASGSHFPPGRKGS